MVEAQDRLDRAPYGVGGDLHTALDVDTGGGEELLAYIEGKLGIKVGESTEDGRYYLKREEECLAACCGAPMMMVDHVYHENLTPEKIDAILDGLE